MAFTKERQKHAGKHDKVSGMSSLLNHGAFPSTANVCFSGRKLIKTGEVPWHHVRFGQGE